MNAMDCLKTISEVMEVDPRTRVTMSYFDEKRGEQHFLTVAEHHAAIAEVSLNDGAPEDIRVNFETARNLYLYAFYVYRFGVVACLQAYQTLEFALRERAKQSGPIPKNFMLERLMTLAIERGWLSDEAFYEIETCRSTKGDAFSRNLSHTLPKLRNELAHGSFNLFEPHRALEQLKICAAIINHIFGGR